MVNKQSDDGGAYSAPIYYNQTYIDIMNNIFVGQNDPLLNPMSTYRIPEQQINPQVLFNQMYANAQKDWIGDLDETSKHLGTDVLSALADNDEYVRLSGALQAAIQSEIMATVKGSLNMNPSIVTNVKRQIEIIESVKNEKDVESKQNLSELNDYMNNYSHLTFDEYKQIKSGKQLPAKQKKNNKETK